MFGDGHFILLSFFFDQALQAFELMLGGTLSNVGIVQGGLMRTVVAL